MAEAKCSQLAPRLALGDRRIITRHAVTLACRLQALPIANWRGGRMQREQPDIENTEQTGKEVNPDTLDPEKIVTPGLEAETDFTDEVDTDNIDVTEVTQEDVSFPPTDSPVTGGYAGGREVLEGGFEAGSTSTIDVEPSASGNGAGDEALADAVRRELSQDAATAGLDVEVRVEEGVVHLRGQ